MDQLMMTNGVAASCEMSPVVSDLQAALITRQEFEAVVREKEEASRCLDEARGEISRLRKEKAEVEMVLGIACAECEASQREFRVFKKESLEVMERASVEMKELIMEREESLKTQRCLDETKVELARVLKELEDAKREVLVMKKKSGSDSEQEEDEKESGAGHGKGKGIRINELRRKNLEFVAEISRLNGEIDLRMKEDMERVHSFKSCIQETMEQISELTEKLQSSEEEKLQLLSGEKSKASVISELRGQLDAKRKQGVEMQESKDAMEKELEELKNSVNEISETTLSILEETLIHMVDNSGDLQPVIQEIKSADDESMIMKPAASILVELESVHKAIGSKSKETESLKQELHVLQESAECSKRRGIWTWMSSATTAVAAIAFVAKRC